MFNKIQTNAVIATGFGGDAAFKNALADIGADADAAVGHFDNQLPGVELDQDFHRLMRQLGTLRGFDGVIQQVADDGDQLDSISDGRGRSMRQAGSKLSATPFSRARVALPSSRPHSVGEWKCEEIKSSSS